jgi:hypothetical protein
MAQLFEIRKVTIGPRNFEVEVEASPSAPLMTSEDPAGTELVLDLMPELRDHICMGDAAPRFGEVVEQTELAHLLEHVSVELLARTNVAGDIASGQTVETGERHYRITLACPDDVLVAGALSSAVWILQWAYAGGGDPRPDVDAIASGLADLVSSLDDAEDADASASAPEAEEPSSREDDGPACRIGSYIRGRTLRQGPPPRRTPEPNPYLLPNPTRMRIVTGGTWMTSLARISFVSRRGSRASYSPH